MKVFRQPIPVDSPDLRLLSTNAFGLHNKFGEFRHNVISHNADIAIIIEIKYSQSIADSEVYIPGYTTTRRDGNANGGGIGVRIKTELPIKRLLDQQDDPHEILWLYVCRCHQDNIIIGAVCRPGSAAENDLALIDHLDFRLYEVRQFGSNIILAGDFNVHNAAWLCSTKTTPAGEALEDVCSTHRIAQHVTDSTRGNNTLDLVISDIEGPVARAIHPLIGRSNHAVVTACFSSAAPHINHPTTRKGWCYSRADWGRLRHFFSTMIWSAVNNDCKISYAVFSEFR